MPSSSRRRRPSPRPAISSSPAPRTIPKPGDAARLGFAEPARGRGEVRGWHHGRIRATRSQRAREILTELVPGCSRLRRDRQPRHRLRPVRPVPLAPPGRGAALLAVPRQSRPARAGRRDHGRGAAPRRAPGASAGPARRGADRRVLRSAAGRAGSAPISARCSRGRATSRTCSISRGAGPTTGNFRSASSCCAAALDGDAAGAALADIAEAVLAGLLPAVAAEFARVHGGVPGGAFADRRQGALGGREMTLASDLDLILIYDAPAAPGSDGPRPLAVSTYYARLSQRLINALTAPTAEGRLYEVDMRLRPSGEAGPVASSFAGFAQYQPKWPGPGSIWRSPGRGRSPASRPCDRACRRPDGVAAPRDRDRLVAMSPRCAAAWPTAFRRRRPGIW